MPASRCRGRSRLLPATADQRTWPVRGAPQTVTADVLARLVPGPHPSGQPAIPAVPRAKPPACWKRVNAASSGPCTKRRTAVMRPRGTLRPGPRPAGRREKPRPGVPGLLYVTVTVTTTPSAPRGSRDRGRRRILQDPHEADDYSQAAGGPPPSRADLPAELPADAR